MKLLPDFGNRGNRIQNRLDWNRVTGNRQTAEVLGSLRCTGSLKRLAVFRCTEAPRGYSSEAGIREVPSISRASSEDTAESPETFSRVLENRRIVCFFLSWGVEESEDFQRNYKISGISRFAVPWSFWGSRELPYVLRGLRESEKFRNLYTEACETVPL